MFTQTPKIQKRYPQPVKFAKKEAAETTANTETKHAETVESAQTASTYAKKKMSTMKFFLLKRNRRFVLPPFTPGVSFLATK